MKKFVAMILVIVSVLALSVPATAEYGCGYSCYSYWDSDLLPYRVQSEFYENGRYVLYMYAEPSSGGTPIAAYYNGDVVKMINWYADNRDAYCYVIGIDGHVGYVRKDRLEPNFNYYSDCFTSYRVNSTFYENGSYKAFMYAQPSSSGNPIATYYNGTIIKVIIYRASGDYSYCVGPDGTVGYVRTAWLQYCW